MDIIKCRRPMATDQYSEDWVKAAMSVCGVSLTQRAKSMTPQPRKDIVVIPQASLAGDSSSSSPEDEDATSDRTDTISPVLSEVRDLVQLDPPDTELDNQNSPPLLLSWTDESGKSKMPAPCHNQDIRMHTDIRIHNDLGTVTASMPSDLKRSLEMGIGTNFSKRLSGLGSSTLDSKTWNKSKHEHKGVMGSGVSMIPRTRRDYLNDVFKVGSFSNARKLDNVDLDVKLAVRQQYYDQWARPKRVRYINFENRLRKNKSDDYTGRNVVKFKEFRKARTKLDDFIGSEHNANTCSTSDTLKPVSSVEIKVPKPVDRNRKLYQSANHEKENMKQRQEETEGNVDKDAMTLTYGDIDDPVNSDRRGLISHSFLEPFTFDRRTEVAPMFVAYRGAYDMSSLRLSDYQVNRSPVRKADDRTLCELGNASGRYPWNKYHIFHFPVKINQGAVSKKPLTEKQEKHLNKENGHLLKIPLIPSKKAPIFSHSDNLCISISSSKPEDNLVKIRNKYNNGVTRESQYSSGLGYERGATAEGEVSGGFSQSTPNSSTRCGQQDRLRPSLELSGRPNVKNRSSSGPRLYTPRLDAGLEVASLMVRGETKLTME